MSGLSFEELIEVKRDGRAHTAEQIDRIVFGYTTGEMPDYQMSAWLMAAFINGLDADETVWMTDAMVRSGRVVDLSSVPGIKVDKHSTGGVADTTTLILAPLVAACGVPVAKMSGRGLGHTGGTLDKLESIPGLSRRADARGVPGPGSRRRGRGDRPVTRRRPGRQEDLRPARCHRDRAQRAAHRGVDHQQEDRGWSRRDRARREGRLGRVHEDGRGRCTCSHRS